MLYRHIQKWPTADGRNKLSSLCHQDGKQTKIESSWKEGIYDVNGRDKSGWNTIIERFQATLLNRYVTCIFIFKC